MFVYNDDLSLFVTRGDCCQFPVTHEFHSGDVVRFKATRKKDCNTVVIQRDFLVEEDTDSFMISLTGDDTKIGEVISKPTDYWYEIELNPDTNPHTIIGYDEDGAKVFRLFPEGKDVDAEDIEVVGHKTLQELVDYALEQAKESGEFDGEDGYTPVKGVDYYTKEEKTELVESATQETLALCADKLEAVESATAKANEATQTANTAANTATLAANNAETATASAQTATAEAENAAGLAKSAASAADTATENATQATEEAVAATSSANTAAEDARAATEATNEAREAFQQTADDLLGITSQVAPAIVKSASGEIVCVHDVSPIAHNANVRVRGKNLIPFPYPLATSTGGGVTYTAQADGGIKATGTATAQHNFTLYYGKILAHGVITFSLNGEYTNLVGVIVVRDRAGTTLFNKNVDNTITVDLSQYPADAITEILVKRKSNVAVSGTVYPQIEMGDTATEYEPYIDPTAVIVTRYGKDEADNPQTFTPSADGTCEIPSLSPTMTLLTNTSGVTVEVEYNQDSTEATRNVVKYEKQKLTDEQKAQARSNMDACTMQEVLYKLSPSFTKSGYAVTCYPLEGYPLEVVSQIVPYQDSNLGEPSVDNPVPIYPHEYMMLEVRHGDSLEYIYDGSLEPGVYGGYVNWNTGELVSNMECLTFTGEENWASMNEAQAIGNYVYLSIGEYGYVDTKATSLCSHLGVVVISANNANNGIYITNSSGYKDARILVRMEQCNFTLAKWIAFLKEQYAAGTPVQACFGISKPTTEIYFGGSDFVDESGEVTFCGGMGETTVSGKADPVAIISKLFNALGNEE